MTPDRPKRDPDRPPARERVLEVASDLFYKNGIHAIGVDVVVERSGVSKTTLYKHFGSKDELVAEVLRRRDASWRAWLEGEVLRRAPDPTGRLLAVFDALADWFTSEDFRGSAFINARAELPDPEHPANVAAADHVSAVRAYFARLAAAAGASDPDRLAAELQLVMKGGTVMALEGEPLAGDLVRSAARAVLAAASVGGAGAARSAPA
jgi:AcrR family transcriptional regulator